MQAELPEQQPEDTGERRRRTDEIKQIVDARMASCKTKEDAEISSVRDGLDRLEMGLTALRNDHHELRADVHRQTIAFQDIASSMREVADTMSKLTDLPEAWNALKGWYKVMQILRQNVLVIMLLVGIISYVAANMSMKDVIGWVLP